MPSLPLSPREIQVLEGFRDGLTRKQIARRLCISMRSVSACTYNARQKLNTQSTLVAVILAIDYEFISKLNAREKNADCVK